MPTTRYILCMTLFNQLTSWDNLLLAFRNASRGKRKNGNVAAFEHRLEDNLWQLHAELQQQKYHPGGYHSFFIHDPKRRLISAAPFRDRVVHHALCQLIQPPFERSFIAYSFANRVGKGTHAARQQCQTYCKRYAYVLQCDIRQFFPSMDHKILENCLAKKVKDEKIMHLIQLVLQSGKDILLEQYTMVYFPNDDLFAISRPRGLPIGNLTSQFWANVYLNPFDHFVKRQLRCKGYLRYVDDFLLFADSKKQLWQWKQQLKQYLGKLRLTIHPRSHPRPVSEGIPFLGFQIFPQQIRLKPRNGYNYRRKLKKMLLQYQSGEIPLDQITASVQGWVNHSRYGNTIGLRKAILSGQQIVSAPPEARNRRPCGARFSPRGASFTSPVVHDEATAPQGQTQATRPLLFARPFAQTRRGQDKIPPFLTSAQQAYPPCISGWDREVWTRTHETRCCR